MGMFDDVNIEVKCDVCGTIVKGFQSKDGCCCLDTLNFWEVDNFYASCPECRKWIEFTLKEEVSKKLREAIENLRKELTIDDYEKERKEDRF